ncbi:MAG TPA: hypothetical protein DDW91_15185 [Shewanella frigidimarina]|nr:hypothetical protein [Shewanella frigidimarina]
MSAKRTGEVKFSQHEFQCLMRDYSKMAIETKNKRLAAKCVKLCLEQVITSVTVGDDDKRLCYRSDNEYLGIARRCLEL